MTAYNPIATMQRLKAAGIPAKHAEALADEMRGATLSLVTQEQLTAALDRQTIRICTIMSATVVAVVTLACTVLGVILSH